MTIKLGATYTDRITGFTGVCTGLCQYISGCNQALLTPKVNADGSTKEAHWYDEQRLVAADGVEMVVLDNGASPGFDKAAPKR
ncbi:hypothetical protein [Devosia beringensis]|uniref:hypothetical protein n=1 Tax=Devosia beringensis TaxID=2657486 RepID=UPI00186B971C|nr:hypothetical protein [Devosia beringensis]